MSVAHVEISNIFEKPFRLRTGLLFYISILSTGLTGVRFLEISEELLSKIFVKYISSIFDAMFTIIIGTSQGLAAFLGFQIPTYFLVVIEC